MIWSSSSSHLLHSFPASIWFFLIPAVKVWCYRRIPECSSLFHIPYKLASIHKNALRKSLVPIPCLSDYISRQHTQEDWYKTEWIELNWIVNRRIEEGRAYGAYPSNAFEPYGAKEECILRALAVWKSMCLGGPPVPPTPATPGACWWAPGWCGGQPRDIAAAAAMLV